MTRTPPTPPKGTPKPRYILRYWSDHARRWNEPGYRDHDPGHSGSTHRGERLYFGRSLTYVRALCAEMRGLEAPLNLPPTYILAITSKGLRVRIGGGAQ